MEMREGGAVIRDGYLPPGVTYADTDRAFGDPEELRCRICGNWFNPSSAETVCEDCCDNFGPDDSRGSQPSRGREVVDPDLPVQ